MSGPEGSTTHGAPPPPMTPPPAPATGPTQPAVPSAVNSMLASYSRGELYVLGGGLLVLLSDLVFDVFGAYSFSHIIWAAAAAAILMVVLAGRMSTSGRTARLLAIGAVGVALYATARNLLLDLLFIPGRSLDVTYFLGAAALYVGVAIMALGAWEMWKTRSA